MYGVPLDRLTIHGPALGLALAIYMLYLIRSRRPSRRPGGLESGRRPGVPEAQNPAGGLEAQNRGPPILPNYAMHTARLQSLSLKIDICWKLCTGWPVY